MNSLTEERLAKLMVTLEKLQNKDIPATLTDVCKLLEMQSSVTITILRELTDIREILEKHQNAT